MWYCVIPYDLESHLEVISVTHFINIGMISIHNHRTCLEPLPHGCHCNEQWYLYRYNVSLNCFFIAPENNKVLLSRTTQHGIAKASHGLSRNSKAVICI